MKTKIFAIACSIVILTSCKKEKVESHTPGNPVTSVNAVEETKAMGRVTVQNDAFNFDDRSELIDAASALSRLKTDITAFKQFYRNKKVKPLELKFDRIDDANNVLCIEAEEANSPTADKSPEFLANTAFYTEIQFPGISGLRYIRNVNWAPLSFVLNEEGAVYIAGIRYHLHDGELLDEAHQIYALFDGQIELPSPAPQPLCNGYMAYNTPSNINSGPLFSGAGSWSGRFVFYLNYTIINSDRCNFTYKVVMTSVGNVMKSTPTGNQNNQMYHLGNFNTNSIAGTLAGIESVGSGYYYTFFGTGSTIVLFNQTIVANNPNGYYHTPTSLSPVSDIVRFGNGVAKFNFNGGSSGGSIPHYYQNY